MDINKWQLEYEGVIFNFGTYDDGTSFFPLKTQVDIGDVERDLQDYPQPSIDGVVMGFERLGGFTLTFECTVVPDPADVADKWINPLDLFAEFKSNWRADSVRTVPGKYATLRNLERNREVYGRPRKCAPTFDSIRKGGASWIADFVTNDPNFYATEEENHILDDDNETYEFDHVGVTKAKTWPTIMIGKGAGGAEVTLEKWDGATWRNLWAFTTKIPTWEMDGDFPIKVPLILVDNPNPSGWQNEGSGAFIPEDPAITTRIPLVVDTRPWTRGTLALDEDTGLRDPTQGIVPTKSLEDMYIPNASGLRFRRVSGEASASIYWRDAFVSL